MQIIRTIVWVLILFGMLTFSFFNWDTVEVNLWENLVLETKVPVLVIVAFLLGMLPMWIILRGTSWRLNRRIGHLEQATRNVAAPPPPQPSPAPSTRSVPPQETDPKLRSE